MLRRSARSSRSVVSSQACVNGWKVGVWMKLMTDLAHLLPEGYARAQGETEGIPEAIEGGPPDED